MAMRCTCAHRLHSGWKHCSRGGLRGFCVDSAVLDGLRHLHPREAAFLLGVPDSAHHHEDVRAALALLGPIAPPLQIT